MASYTLLDPSVPAGSYDAIFHGVAEKSFTFGDCLIWSFLIEGGDHDGREVAGFSGVTPTLKSRCGQFLAALVGDAPRPGRSINPDDHIGKLYRVKVDLADNGESTRVVDFQPSDAEPSEAAEGETPF